LVEIDLTTLRLTCSRRPARTVSGKDLGAGYSYMWDGAGVFLTGADMKQTRCVRVYPDQTLRAYPGERGISIVTEKDGVTTRRDVAIEISGSAGPSYGFGPVLIWGDPSNPKVLVDYDRLIQGRPIVAVPQLCLVEPFSDKPEPRLVDSSAVCLRPFMPIVAGDNVYLPTGGVGIMSLSTLKVEPFRQAESLISERFPDVESDLVPSLGHYGHVVLVLYRGFIWGFDEDTLDVLFELRMDPETRTVTGPANTVTVPGSGVLKTSGILAPKS
jgi:hypothetical protein